MQRPYIGTAILALAMVVTEYYYCYYYCYQYEMVDNNSSKYVLSHKDTWNHGDGLEDESKR
jgi:hypothetical protein